MKPSCDKSISVIILLSSINSVSLGGLKSADSAVLRSEPGQASEVLRGCRSGRGGQPRLARGRAARVAPDSIPSSQSYAKRKGWPVPVCVMENARSEMGDRGGKEEGEEREGADGTSRSLCRSASSEVG